MLKLKEPQTQFQVECILRLPDDRADSLLVEFAAHEMRERLRSQRKKGFHGWHGPNCTNEDLFERLRKNLEKGDLVDVLNLTAMALARKHLYGDMA